MKTLIWDFDGTLGYRTGRWARAILEVITEEYSTLSIEIPQIRTTLQGGFPWHQPETHHTHICTADAWWEMLYPVLEMALVNLGVKEGAANRLARHVRARYTDPTTWMLFDDVLLGLDQLDQLGWQHVILSNHVPELGYIVEYLGLNEHIHQIFNSAEMGYEKPNPEAFHIVLDTLQENDEVWMIGDNINADVLGAKSVGLQAILLRKNHPNASISCENIWQAIDLLES